MVWWSEMKLQVICTYIIRQRESHLTSNLKVTEKKFLDAENGNFILLVSVFPS